MATGYKTPNVYVEEQSLLPPSVAEVSTAIPAFVGHTAKGTANVPTRISSLVEYEATFGGAEDTSIAVTVTGKVVSITTPTVSNLMYYAMRQYFDNGGGPCWVVSAGTHNASGTRPTATNLKAALDTLEGKDEPTLLVVPDAVLASSTDYYSVCNAILDQAGEQKDRFGILDVVGDKAADLASFRTGITSTSTAYGAAYYPFVKTSMNVNYSNSSVQVAVDSAAAVDLDKVADATVLADIKAQLAKLQVTMPPSAAVAGAYTRTDRQTGVWKAPANTPLQSVLGPTVAITDGNGTNGQDDMNEHSTGKSINAIRAFTGKGTLIWGARTLDGLSNEWRYIPVRRLFNFIEESVQKSTQWAVFEPNTAMTWLKVSTMIESFLDELWRQGALAGEKPEHAYFVNVGLNKTMTPADILAGKLIVEIGIAAVRPAEFIILRFSHKLQES